MSRYNQPEKGASDWHHPLNQNFADLGIEVTNEVATFADLPEPTGETSSNGVPRRYLVLESGTIYRDTGGQWEAITGSGGRIGEFGIRLNGLRNPDSPRGGLAGEVRSALDSGRSYIDITGAWRLGGDITFSSGSYEPIGVIIDARGAYVEYDGSGWAITNDNTGNVGSQLRGGTFQLYGGFWKSTGDPDGFIRGIDQSGAQLYPKQTRDWKSDGKVSAVYQIEEGSRWCENNALGGRHHLVDTGIRSIASSGASFQDNYVDNIHLSSVEHYGFDLSGNWIDCTFNNPTVIFDSDGAFLRMNGNMEGSEIIAPEMEDATADVDDFYMVEVGPDGITGPFVRGGKLNRNFNNITLFDTANASRAWTFQMDYAEGGTQVRGRYGRSGNTRWLMDGSGMRIQQASNPNGPWETRISFP